MDGKSSGAASKVGPAGSTTSIVAAGIASSNVATDADRPRDALAMDGLLRSVGVTRYEPKVINQLMEFMHR
jgi:hypothetical protein